MLTELEIGHFRAFGYVLLKDCLTSDEVHRLQRAFDRVIESDPRVDDARGDGTRNLSFFAGTDDAFDELIEHPKIMEAMRDIDGAEFLYTTGENMAAFAGDTVWHCDYLPPHHEFRPVKTAFYLDEMWVSDGALCLIPGTHHPSFAAAILRAVGYYGETGGPRLRMDASQVPAVPIETTPRDVVLWENHMWHHAPRRKDGKPRRAMFIQYFRDPKGNIIAAKGIREMIKTILNRKDSPYVYSRAMMEKRGAAREKMAARLEELGVENVRES